MQPIQMHGGLDDRILHDARKHFGTPGSNIKVCSAMIQTPSPKLAAADEFYARLGLQTSR